MNYYEALFLIVIALGGIFFTLYILHRFRTKKAMENIERLPFPEKYETILTRLPHFRRLSAEDQAALRRSVLRFIHTKEFIGIDLGVTEEMKVLIAFYACLLLLRKNAPLPYPELTTVLIYPDSVVVEQNRTEGGIHTSEEVEIDGQSANGTVVITWDAARSEAYAMGPYNLILHEFAHEIDFMDGEIDGVPPMERSRYHEWVDVFDREFDALSVLVHKNADLGKYALFGPDAALDEAEFFAVATERFFGESGVLKEKFPGLYDQLKIFYGIDAAELFS
ncbi:MAG: hypothetical protein JU82_00725 [Sulfuricurvum sp. MLSB]|uniref:M90 family metallopeptidase n=1 Tax=unclassified Sulfuricurvum TaxID=2632390 RepID=UPI000504399B|nr:MULTISPECIES: M90 family metallopeptidase [unclassified Sulfuricurvum]KFN40840.1 MAG: hypothetical protein JU82_00725 [Sulfuricurvum sp. MLSB]